MINHFTFNGTSTAQLGLIVSGVSIFGAGSRKVEKAGIPGRNGDLQIELGGFNNYTVRYTVSITKNFTTTAQQIREWLLESKGYCELTDTYHPDEIRKACFNSDIEFTTTMLYKYGQASIQFDCLPQRYIIRNTPITTTPTEDTTTGTTVSINTVATPIKMTLNGNTTQEGTPTPEAPQAIHNVSGDNTVNVVSKNIMQITRQEQTINNVKFTPTSDGTILVNGTASANVSYPIYGSTLAEKGIPLSGGTTYILSGDDKGISVNIQIMRNGSAITISSTQAVNYFTAQDGDYISFCWLWQPSGTVFNNVILKPMIEKGSTATNFEPYTEQSYPLYLPVENYLNAEELVTENNVFKKNSENNFTLTKVSTSSRLTSWATCNIENGKTYTFHMKAENGFSSGVKIRSGINGSQIQDIGTLVYSSKVYSITFVASANAQQLQIYFVNSATGVGESATVTDLQLEEGTKTNSYTPYGTTPIELNKIGTYQDYIYKNGGKWYVHKAFNTITLDGSSDENVRKNVEDTTNYLYYWMGLPNIDATQLGYVYCNRLINTIVLDNINGGNGTVNLGCAMRSSSSQSVFYFNVGVYLSDNTLATVKTWLASNPLTFIYPLATPTNTEITDTTLINQLNNIEKAYSYNGTTNILQVSNDNGFMLEVVSLHGSTFASSYKGEPIITVNSTGLIYLNGKVMEVLSAPVTINCQTMQCYNGSVNMNNEVRVNEFPEIKIGANEVGSSMALIITPNNWRH